MIELFQLPYSPFCIVQRRILEYAGTRFKLINIPNDDRHRIWRLTRQRYYQLPVLRHDKQVVFETDEASQVIAKYLDEELHLGLFPRQWTGLQRILWLYIEGDIEATGAKLNDIYYPEFIPEPERLGFVRHKERKFGRGCLGQWRQQQLPLLEHLIRLLAPFEQMVAHRPFLLDGQPRFVDFDLYGMLANFLYSGHYEFPAQYPRLQAWYGEMAQIKFKPV